MLDRLEPICALVTTHDWLRQPLNWGAPAIKVWGADASQVLVPTVGGLFAGPTHHVPPARLQHVATTCEEN